MCIRDSPESITYTPTRKGYKLEGWYTDSSLTNKVVDGNENYTPTEDITLYATWIVDEEQTKNLSYTVEYYKAVSYTHLTI